MATLAEPLPVPRSGPRLADRASWQVRRLVIAHALGRDRGLRGRLPARRLADVGAKPARGAGAHGRNYFRSVTLHGVSMAFVLTTFFIMGFGYFVAETALKRPVPGCGSPGAPSGWGSSAC